MANLIQFINDNNSLLTIFSLGITIATLLLLLMMSVKLSRINKRYKKLTQGIDNKNLEQILNNHIERVGKVVEQVNSVDNTCQELKKLAEKSVRKVGIIRFNAFKDTGSDLSFAVALLDSFGDGFIISSIFAREDQRVYLKPVKNGTSSHNLSNEEMQSIKKAMEQK